MVINSKDKGWTWINILCQAYTGPIVNSGAVQFITSNLLAMMVSQHWENADLYNYINFFHLKNFTKTF